MMLKWLGRKRILASLYGICVLAFAFFYFWEWRWSADSFIIKQEFNIFPIGELRDLMGATNDEIPSKLQSLNADEIPSSNGDDVKQLETDYRSTLKEHDELTERLALAEQRYRELNDAAQKARSAEI